MITEKLITDAWVFLRTNNNSIPDDVLDFIKESSLAALRQQNLQQYNVSGALCHSCNANIAEEFIPKCYCPECGNEWHNDR